MADILIRGYKAKEQIEEIIKEARYAANNSMIGSGLEIVELPEHGRLIDADKLLHPDPSTESTPFAFTACKIIEAPTVIPSNKEAQDD